MGEKTSITEKSGYFLKGAVPTVKPIGDAIIKFGLVTEKVNRYRISYSNSRFDVAVARFNSYLENTILGKHDTRGGEPYKSWNEYPYNNPLINLFKKLN